MVALLVAAMSFAQMRNINSHKESMQKAKTSLPMQRSQILEKGTTLSTEFNKTRTSGSRAISGTLKLCGNLYGGLGTDNAGTFSAGARFETTDLTNYVSQYITKISVGINNANVITSAKVAILTGTTDEPVVAMEQTCTFVNGMNDIFLTTPYQIPAETAIMIAYEVVATGGYPLGIDEGPAVPNGDLVAMGTLGTGFMSVASQVNNNIVISATVENNISDPIIYAYPLSLDFVGSVEDEATEAKTVSVTSFRLTEGISVTTEAPFEVSADNTVFATTATLNEDGNLYVRYIPSNTATTATGVATLTSTGAEAVEITLLGLTYDCSTPINAPWEETFDANSASLNCWTVRDANEDENTFEYENGFYVLQYSDEFDSDDWLISPILNIAEGDYAEVKVAHYAGYWAYPETYNIYAITSSDEEVLLREALVTTTAYDEFETVIINNLSQFAGQQIKIGIQCVTPSADAYFFFVGGLSLKKTPTTPEIALTRVNPRNNSYVHTGEPFSISGVINNNGSALNSYTVSYTVDNGDAIDFTIENISVPYMGTHEFEHTTPITLTTDGQHTIVVTVSNPNGTTDNAEDNSMTINVTSASCTAITEFPWTEGFENGLPVCWNAIDNDGDGHNWYYTNDVISLWDPEETEEITYFTHNGNGSVISESYNNYQPYEALDAENYLITPQITLPAEGGYKLYFNTANIYGYTENITVKISTTGYDTDDFTTTLLEEEEIDVDLDNGEWAEKEISLLDYAGQNVYIAFIHTGYNGVGLLIDDVEIREMPTNDITLRGITFETSSTCGNTNNLKATVKNNGTTPISTFSISYTVNNGTPVSENVTLETAIAPDATYEYSFTNTITVEEDGLYEVTVTVTLANDANTEDNTMNGSFHKISPAAIPYTVEFSSEDATIGWSIFDVNNDDNSWYFDEDYGFRYLYNEYEDANDWLISPCLNIPAGTYKLQFNYSAGNSFPESLNVFFGTAPTVEAMTNAIVDLPSITGTSLVDNNFTIETENVYYIGFHCYSEADMYHLSIADVHIEAITTSVEENIESAIAVYPNPANDVITIANAEGQNIAIVNTLGQVVSEINNAAANQTIDISNLANGTYFVKVNAEVVKINVVK